MRENGPRSLSKTISYTVYAEGVFRSFWNVYGPLAAKCGVMFAPYFCSSGILGGGANSISTSALGVSA